MATTANMATLDDRDARALTEPMDVYADDPAAPSHQVAVYHHGDRHLVDADAGVCDCPDMLHRRPDGGCKHIRRVLFERGDREIPQWANRDAIDLQTTPDQ